MISKGFFKYHASIKIIKCHLGNRCCIMTYIIPDITDNTSFMSVLETDRCRRIILKKKDSTHPWTITCSLTKLKVKTKDLN